MKEHLTKLSRRDLLVKTALLTAGSFLGTSPLLSPLAHALSKKIDGSPAAPAYKNPKLAIIIDDVGGNAARVEPFLHLGLPITFSILPHLAFSSRLAEKIHASGHEVMLHQPMEALNRLINPGPGALYLSQSMQDMQKIIQKNITSFPYAVGFNNHMGSRFTESRPKMTDTLKIFKERDFFFVDSITSRHSIAFDTARDMNMTAAFRNEFLDNTLERRYVYSQLIKLKNHAQRFGHAVGIGHPRPETVKALKQFLAEIKDSGFSIVYASQIVRS